MTVTYKIIEEPKKKNCYEFVFSFEHGDADSEENYSVVFGNMNENQLIDYVKKSDEISKMIGDSRSSGSKLPKDFEKQATSGEFNIPVELDNYAKMHVSNYYAASGISKIFYYNEHGQKFEVKIES